MPAALALSVRQHIIARRQRGERLASIARELQVSYNAVRNLWRQFQTTGQLTPHYDRCRHPGVRKDRSIYAQAVALKQTHAGWGAGLIRLELAEQYDAAALPSERTLQRWFRQAGVARSRPERRPGQQVQRGQEAHEVWAMDAKEQMRLADGSYASWLTLTDEGSGAVLGGILFPHPPLEPGEPAGGQGGASADDDAMGASRPAAGG